MLVKRNRITIYALLLTAAFSFRLAVALFLPNDEPFDGHVYSQFAHNLLEHRGYSHAAEPPYEPSLIRLPGYPLFLAGIYSIFGHSNNTAVRIIQALIDTATCALVGLLAFFWEPDEKLKQRTSIAALSLAALCPFTAIYVAIILTETPTAFFAVAMCVTATLAFNAPKVSKAVLLWGATGLLAGVAVLFRPDSGLFAAAIGITLVVTTVFRWSNQVPTNRGMGLPRGLQQAFYRGAVFSLAFCLVLVPWTIRNYRVFHLFQPLAPAHADMPGEFVPRGYLSWLRTWIDDSRYIDPLLWSLDEDPIKLDDIPDSAFDSAAEKQKVAALLERYNHATDQDSLFVEPRQPIEQTPPGDQSSPGVGNRKGNVEPEGSPSEKTKGDSDEESSEDDQGEEPDEEDENSSNQSSSQAVDMTPEIDSGFAEIAKERVSRDPIRYFVWLPLKRGLTLWFDTHSQYYPFAGELLPFSNLDAESHQQLWLPLFALLTFLYTLLGCLGGSFLWQTRDFASRRWLILVVLTVFLRIGFFATLENPEPRYVVELFPFLCILGGISFSRAGQWLKTGTHN
ncbi:MAG: ArnT family glycosyltransferase [Pyrinomonadaceae bacterium]